jgi:hypothetical protein
MNQILSAHPELQKDIIALSFLKDPILLSNLQNPDTVRKMGEHHRILLDASETICKALKSVKLTPSTTTAASETIPIPSRFNFEDLSDTSSSSGSGSESNSPQASTSSTNSAARRITSDFLRRSLASAQAARQNQNSLANISQRNLNQGESNASTTSSSASSAAPAAVPSSGRRNLISSSMMLHAMNEILQARRSEADVYRQNSADSAETPLTNNEESQVHDTDQEQEQEQQEEEESAQMETEDESARDAHDIEMITNFQEKLRQMEMMGLTNKAANIQALMVCNGDLETAVNFVLTEMSEN